jgi:hypothetical protein
MERKAREDLINNIELIKIVLLTHKYLEVFKPFYHGAQ